MKHEKIEERGGRAGSKGREKSQKKGEAEDDEWRKRVGAGEEVKELRQ